jgi:DNA-binding SARP family transcriptional activator
MEETLVSGPDQPGSVPRRTAKLVFLGMASAEDMTQDEVPRPHGQAWRALAYLAVNRRRPIPKDELAEALWGESLPSTWEAALRGVVKKVRDFLTTLGCDGPSCVRTAYGCYQLDLGDQVDFDIDRVNLAFSNAELSLGDGRTDDALSEAEFATASSGVFLTGEDGAWVEAERIELARTHVRALEIVSEAARRTGRFARAIEAADEAIASDELNETAHRMLIDAHQASGDRAQALRAYDRCRTILSDQLGVDPSPATQDVHLRVLRAQGPEDVGRHSFPSDLHDDAASFVGRVGELDRLNVERLLTLEGSLRLVVLAGDPGIGKTRLAAEAARRAHDAGATVLYGRCDEDALGPYQPFIEAISRIVRGLHPATIPAGIARLLPDGDTTASASVDPSNADPMMSRMRLFEAVANVITGAVLDQAGVVLVLDDLHWADRPTLLLLEHIARTCARAPVLIVGTYRGGAPPETLIDTFADVRRSQTLTELRLGGLEIDEFEMLVRGADDRLPAAFAQALHERTDGNPFFAIEILWHLREGSDAIELDPHHLDDSGIPTGVTDVIHRRLSRLGEHVQEVLLMASVIGRNFDLELTEHLVRPGSDVPLALEEATGAGLVSEIPDVLGRYRFSHHLVRQVLYDDLSPTRRARLHLRVGEALEEICLNGPESRAAELAHHFAIAAPVGDPEKAVRYLELSADRAMRLLAFEDAAAQFERGLALVPDEDDPARARITISLADAYGHSGEIKRACLTLFDVIPLARGAGLLDELGEALLRATSFLASNWDQELWEAGLEGLAQLPDGDSALRVILISRLALATQSFGAPTEATRQTVALSVEGHDMAARIGDATALAAAIQARILCDPSAELVPRRRDLLNQLVALSIETRDDPLLMNAHLWLGMEHLAEGHLGDARACMDEFDRLGSVTGHPWTEWRTTATRTNWAIMRGEFALAEDLMTQELEIGRAAGVPQARLYHSLHVFQTRRDQGRLHEIQERSLAFYAKVPAMGNFELMTYIEAGMTDEARALLARHLEDDVALVARNYPGWWIGICLLSYACDALDETESAQVLYNVLAPYAGRHIVWSGLASYWGPADLALGGLAATCGRSEVAERHLSRALQMCEEVESATWSTRTRLRLGALLLETHEARARGVLGEARETAERLGMKGVLRSIQQLI